jgi:hypothetical protein
MPRIPVHLPDDVPETLRELPARLGAFDGHHGLHIRPAPNRYEQG